LTHGSHPIKKTAVTGNCPFVWLVIDVEPSNIDKHERETNGWRAGGMKALGSFTTSQKELRCRPGRASAGDSALGTHAESR
jgi:hypothetical protein